MSVKPTYDLIKELANDNDFVLTFGTQWADGKNALGQDLQLLPKYKEHLASNHVHSMTRYNPDTNKVAFINPWDSTTEIEIPIDVLCENISVLTIARVNISQK